LDSFDRKIIKTLDQKPQTFHQIFTAVGFTHNTLQQHLDQLLERGLVERHKQPQEGPGRPVYVYSIPKNLIGMPISAILNPETGLVVLSLDGLQRLCRHEKGGYCKEIRSSCGARDCPKIMR
jgi:DNA-binding transcriptional ArsR family regulator